MRGYLFEKRSISERDHAAALRFAFTLAGFAVAGAATGSGFGSRDQEQRSSLF